MMRGDFNLRVKFSKSCLLVHVYSFVQACLLLGTSAQVSKMTLKAQVSFSDQNLSVLQRSLCCLWRCRKLFTFSPSSPEPLSQFQPNLAQSILGEGDSSLFK